MSLGPCPFAVWRSWEISTQCTIQYGANVLLKAEIVFSLVCRKKRKSKLGLWCKNIYIWNCNATSSNIVKCLPVRINLKQHFQERIFQMELNIPRQLPQLLVPSFMSHHENLKSTEACKQETYISDNCFSQSGFIFTKREFFLPKWLLQCWF